jgi:hypothetical protein
MVDATNVAKRFLWEILYAMNASMKIKPSVKNNKKKQCGIEGVQKLEQMLTH